MQNIYTADKKDACQSITKDYCAHESHAAKQLFAMRNSWIDLLVTSQKTSNITLSGSLLGRLFTRKDFILDQFCVIEDYHQNNYMGVLLDHLKGTFGATNYENFYQKEDKDLKETSYFAKFLVSNNDREAVILFISEHSKEYPCSKCTDESCCLESSCQRTRTKYKLLQNIKAMINKTIIGQLKKVMVSILFFSFFSHNFIERCISDRISRVSS